MIPGINLGPMNTNEKQNYGLAGVREGSRSLSLFPSKAMHMLSLTFNFAAGNFKSAMPFLWRFPLW